MILLVVAPNFQPFSPAFFFFRIVIAKLIVEFFGLWAIPEHWLKHDSFLSVMIEVFIHG